MEDTLVASMLLKVINGYQACNLENGSVYIWLEVMATKSPNGNEVC